MSNILTWYWHHNIKQLTEILDTFDTENYDLSQEVDELPN